MKAKKLFSSNQSSESVHTEQDLMKDPTQDDKVVERDDSELSEYDYFEETTAAFLEPP